MTQSVELLLDRVAEEMVEEEWQALRTAGLPSELRSPPVGSHRPHLTLYAGTDIPAAAELVLAELMRGLRLRVQLGAVMVFGPACGSYVLVHSVVPSVGLLTLQQAVAEACDAEPNGHFAAGCWTPHVTLARRMSADQVPAALAVLARCAGVGQPVEVTRCRRWDSVERRTWLL